MKIGIIGAGNVGGTLTRRLRALGHEVAVANSRGPDTLRGLATETGAEPVTVADAVKGRNLVIVSIPEGRVRELPGDLFADVGAETVVVDTGNYYPQRDGRIDEIERGMAESRWVSRQLNRLVVKAFNNIRAGHLMQLERAAGDPDRIALPVAGDDPRAKSLVMRLVDELGFDPVDGGGLDESWRQQPGTPVYATDQDETGVRRALAEATRQRPPEFRAGVRQAAD